MKFEKLFEEIMDNPDHYKKNSSEFIIQLAYISDWIFDNFEIKTSSKQTGPNSGIIELLQTGHYMDYINFNKLRTELEEYFNEFEIIVDEKNYNVKVTVK